MPPASRRSRAFVAMLALVPAFSGCYNAGNHALAQSAQKSLAEAKLSQSLEGEKTLSRQMREAELAAVEENIEAQRDNALAVLLDGSWDGFLSELDRRLDALVGEHESASQILSAARTLEQAEANLRQAEMTYALAAAPLLGPEASPPALACPLPEKLERPAALESLIRFYASQCAEREKRRAAFDKLIEGVGSGELGELNTRYVEQKKAIEATQSASEAQKTAYFTALAAYVKAKESPIPVSSAELESLKSKVDSAFEGLQKAAQQKGFIGVTIAKIAALEVHYDTVARAASAFASGKAASGTLTEIALSALSRDRRIAEEERLPLLLFEAERLGGELEAARVEANFVKWQVSLLEAERRAAYTELEELLGAERAARAVTAAPTGPNEAEPKACASRAVSVHVNFDNSSGACKQGIAEALLRYTNSWTLGRKPARRAAWEALAMEHDKSIALSAVAMRRWERALAIPLAEIERLHASGAKPETIAQIVVQALGLTAVTAAVVAK